MFRKLRHINISVVAFGAMMAFLTAFFLWPIGSILQQAFLIDGTFTTAYISDVLNDRNYQQGLVNALTVAVWSTAGAIVLALPLAILADRYEFPFKTLLVTLLLVPLILPPFVGAIGVKQILGQTGSLNVFLSWFGLVDMEHPVDWLGQYRFQGMVMMNALHLYPIVFLNVAASLSNLNPSLEEAAENLGCSPQDRFFSITLPLTLPGLFAGSTIAFVWAFTELGVPLVFDFSRITPVQIFDGIKSLSPQNPFPYALVTVVMCISGLVFLIGKKLVGDQDFASDGRAMTGRHLFKLSGWGQKVTMAAFILVALAGSVPHIGVVFMSIAGDWYESVLPNSITLAHFQEALGHSVTLPSIANSLRYAGFATLLNLVLGIAIAYVVVRTNIRGRHLLDTIAMMPLAVPGLVLAFGYLAMTREGRPFRWIVENHFFELESPVLLLIIAYAVRRLPYIVRSAIAGFQQTSRNLEEAAANLGAGPMRTMTQITIPLIGANLLAGAILAFAFSVLEVSDSLMLAQRQVDYPITTAIYMLFNSLGRGPYLAAALGVWAMVFLGVSIAGARLLLGKRMGSLFRA